MKNCQLSPIGEHRSRCYDRAFASLLAAPKPRLTTKSRHAKPRIEENETFDKSLKATDRDSSPTSDKSADQFGLAKPDNANPYIISTINRIEKDAELKRYFQLDSGQIWKEQTIKRMKLEVGDQIRIDKSGAGSFFLSKHGIKKRLKVKRIK